MATVKIHDELRQALRDELVQVTADLGALSVELMQVAADLGALRERRAELVRRLHACGDSTRAIAELAGMSHTQVRDVVVITGAKAWARARHDELRDELRAELMRVAADLEALRVELMQVTADLGALRERRDELVRRLHACGDSTRAIAGLAGTSHTQIRRII